MVTRFAMSGWAGAKAGAVEVLIRVTGAVGLMTSCTGKLLDVSSRVRLRFLGSNFLGDLVGDVTGVLFFVGDDLGGLSFFGEVFLGELLWLLLLLLLILLLF